MKIKTTAKELNAICASQILPFFIPSSRLSLFCLKKMTFIEITTNILTNTQAKDKIENIFCQIKAFKSIFVDTKLLRSP